ncbi:MAG: MCE family protein [Gemmatimonadetes bacterium]|nr:MCE family protein [Gemmatimonadota bacterium]
MDLHYKQEVSVGLMVIAATALFAAGLAWLSGKRIGPSSTARVPVRFTDVLGLRSGDPVQTSGVKVGRVEDVVLEDVGRVMVYLSVDADARPHADARAAVAALDLLGAKYIDYSPGKSAELLRPGQAITGAREMALAEGAAGLAQRATEAIASAQTIFSQRTADDIHNTMVAATRALDMATRIGGGPQLQQAAEAVRSLQVIATRLDSILGNPAINKSLDQLDELTTSLNEMAQGLASTSQSLGSILKKMDEGQGMFGKMANDTTLYHDLHETMLKIQQLIDDIQKNPRRYVPPMKVF